MNPTLQGLFTSHVLFQLTPRVGGNHKRDERAEFSFDFLGGIGYIRRRFFSKRVAATFFLSLTPLPFQG